MSELTTNSAEFPINIITPISGETALRITDRPFKEVAELCHFDAEDVRRLAPGTVLLEAGSGTHQAFLRDAYAINQEIILVGLDLSLSIKPDDLADGRIRVSRYQINGIEVTDYYLDARRPSTVDSKGELTTADAVTFHKTRKSFAEKLNMVSMNMQDGLALSSGSVDMYVDCFGPAVYIRSAQEKLTYLTEVLRVLKAGGKAYIYPLFQKAGYHDPEFGPDSYDDVDLVETLLGACKNARATIVHNFNVGKSRKQYNTGLIIEMSDRGPNTRGFNIVCTGNH